MPDEECPKCGESQEKPFKQWSYSHVKVSRFKCKCGQIFNFYKGKNSKWTIPKKTDTDSG